MDETRHFKDMLVERSILRKWVEQTLAAPDRTERLDDGTVHYFRCIPENGARWLKVVVNERAEPSRLVTVYFDRSARRRYENQG